MLVRSQPGAPRISGSFRFSPSHPSLIALRNPVDQTWIAGIGRLEFHAHAAVRLDDDLAAIRRDEEVRAVAPDTNLRLGCEARPSERVRELLLDRRQEDARAGLAQHRQARLHRTRFEKRAISKSTAYGATPTSVYSSIVEHLVQANPLRDVATLITTQSGENLNVPTTSAFSTASIVGEGSQASTSDPTFVNSRTLGAYKYVVLVQLSNELALDAGVDVAGFLGRQAGTAIGVATRGHMTTGSGSSQPYGIATNSTAGVTGATSASGAFMLVSLKGLTPEVVSQPASQTRLAAAIPTIRPAFARIIRSSRRG